MKHSYNCILSIVLVVLFSPFSGFGQAISSGLVAWYPFCGDAIDSSQNNNDGIVMGANLTDDRHGIPGTAYLFDGVNDFIACGDGLNSLNIPFSISAWVYDEFGTTRSYIYSTDDNPTSDPNVPDGYYYGFQFIVTEDNSLALTYGDGTGAGIEHRRMKESTLKIPEKEWTHVLAIVNGPTDIDLYINGQEAGGVYTGQGGAMVHNDWPIMIGKRTLRGPAFFNGMLDDIYLFNRLLDTSEVQILYTEGPCNTTSNDKWEKNPLSISPNPATDLLMINAGTGERISGDLTLVDLAGREVFKQVIDEKELLSRLEINISHIARGLYILSLQNGNRGYYQKVWIR